MKLARERRGEVAHTIREQLDCVPEACLSLAALKQGAAVPPQVEVEARLQKLKGDRERLGGVNLRAEEEEAELSAKLEEMEREKADVEEAITRLRQGISNLNREGRKRLLEAFDTRERAFPTPVQDPVRRRHGRAQAGRFRRSARIRARDPRLPTGQKAAGPDAALRRREGADRAGA